MASSTPTAIKTDRRKSFLEIGGPNSLNQFASSFKRAQTYLAIDVDNDNDLSPRTSAEALLGTSVPSYGPSDNAIPTPRASLLSFHFPGSEVEPALHRVSQRRPSSASMFLALKEITGDSTAPQTIFNSINVLVGIGILSLPLGLLYCGWVYGLVLLTLSAVVTRYTAMLLGRVLARHESVYSYGELAKHCYGTRGQYVVSAIFCFDLVGACVSMIILFADSLEVIVPYLSLVQLKLVVVVSGFLFSFLPFSILSILSLIGIICTTSIVVLITVCGFFFGGASAPGSLLAPALTHMWPTDLPHVLLGLGIFMAPWGGHAVFPELYRDMRHPHKYEHCVTVTFFFAYGVDLWLAVVGFLMFGSEVAEEITQNLINLSKYPVWVGTAIALLMGLLPLAKSPLLAKPILTATEQLLGLERRHHLIRMGVKVAVFTLFFGVSVVVTSFGRMMAFLGSAICFTICVTLPLLFYRNVFYHDMSKRDQIMFAVAASISGGLCIAGSFAAVMY